MVGEDTLEREGRMQERAGEEVREASGEAEEWLAGR